MFFWDDDWDELCAADDARSDDVRAITASLSPDDPINIQYTSGTTGFPKGATLTHRGIGLQELGPGDRLCIPVPF